MRELEGKREQKNFGPRSGWVAGRLGQAEKSPMGINLFLTVIVLEEEAFFFLIKVGAQDAL